MSRRRFIAALGAGIGGVALAACKGGGGSTSSAGTPAAIKPGGTLQFAVTNEPDFQSLDVNRTTGTWTHYIGMTIFDTLLVKDRQTESKLVPSLASSYESAPDLTSFTFKVRQGVVFHDGTSFDAAAVKYMMDRATDPKNSAALAFSYTGPNYKSTEAIDPQTAKINFVKPNPVMLSRLTRAYFGIPSPTAVEKMGLDKFSRSPVASGAFVFKDWAAKDHVTVAKNPAYAWAPEIFANRGAPYLDSVNFRVIPEPATKGAALESGDVKVIEEPSFQDIPRYLSDGRFRGIQSYPQGTSYLLYLNSRRPPTDDINVRKAIEHAIDKDAIIKTVYFGIHQPAYSPITSSTFGWDGSLKSMYPHDTGKAGQLLDQAGWTMGSGGVRQKNGQDLSLSMLTSFKDLPELVQAQLKQVGVKLDITVLPPGTQVMERAMKYTDHILDGQNQQSGFLNEDPDILRTTFSPDYIGKQQQATFIGYNDPKFTELLNTQQEHLNDDTRAGILKQAQQTVMQNALVVPIFDGHKTIVTGKDIDGVWIGPVLFYAFLNDAHFV
jgi:peptide/nickel transport system substrate-binding protein